MNLFDLPRKPSLAESYIVPLVGLGIITLIDQNVSSVLLTPMLSICLLGMLAFRLETKVLTFWLVILSCNVVLSLIDNPSGGRTPNWETILVRSFGFVVSGTIAVAMNRGRANLTRNHRHLLEMLERLPCGVVVSDSSGTLLFANRMAAGMLGKRASELLGLSFFSSFTSPEQRGHAIQNYLRLTEQEISSDTTLTIVPDAERRVNVQATQMPMNLIGQKCIVTVIELDGNTPKRRSTDPKSATWTGITTAVVEVVESSERENQK
ncbi:hypothetical protein BH09VER1_BH09VER1_00290 [soil metagenome]